MGEEESRNRQPQSTSTGERLKAVGKNLLKGFWDFFVYAAGIATELPNWFRPYQT